MAPDEVRQRYQEYLINRLRTPRAFLTATQEARALALQAPPRPLLARR